MLSYRGAIGCEPFDRSDGRGPRSSPHVDQPPISLIRKTMHSTRLKVDKVSLVVSRSRACGSAGRATSFPLGGNNAKGPIGQARYLERRVTPRKGASAPPGQRERPGGGGPRGFKRARDTPVGPIE